MFLRSFGTFDVSIKIPSFLPPRRIGPAKGKATKKTTINHKAEIADNIVITRVTGFFGFGRPSFIIDYTGSELMLKISDNPPVVYPINSVIESIYGQWRVAHTKARNEKALARSLQQWEIPYFLPMREKLSIRSGRKFKTLLPLFSGYLFFCGDDDKRYKALTTNRIAHVIEVVDQQGLIGELTQIHRALQGGLELDPHPYLKEGIRCRVIAGPLMGLEGIVLRKKSVTRLVLQVDMLGQAAAAEIDADLLEPIE